jgi:hypothetical protein
MRVCQPRPVARYPSPALVRLRSWANAAVMRLRSDPQLVGRRSRWHLSPDTSAPLPMGTPPPVASYGWASHGRQRVSLTRRLSRRAAADDRATMLVEYYP